MLYCQSPDLSLQADIGPCAAGTFDVAVADAGPGAVYDWQISGASILSGAGSPQLSLLADESGLIEVSLTVTLPNGCRASEQWSFPIAAALPDAPITINGSTDICAGSFATFSVASASAPSYQWLLPDGATVVSGQGTAEVEVYFEQFVPWLEVVAENGCGISESSRVELVQADQIEAGDDQYLCDITQATLAANPPLAGQAGQWSILSGQGGTFADATDPDTEFSGRPGTLYLLQWEVSSTCGPLQDFVVVSFESSTRVSAGEDIYLCQDVNTVRLNADLPPGSIGTWRFPDSDLAPNVSYEHDPYATFWVNEGQIYELIWEVETPHCGTFSDSVKVAVVGSLFASAGMDQRVPVGQPAQLRGGLSTGGRGRWVILAGPTKDLSLLSDPTDPAAIFQASAIPATYLLEWQASFGTCQVASDRMLLEFENVSALPQRLADYETTNLLLDQPYLDPDGVYFWQNPPGNVSQRMQYFDFATRTSNVVLENREPRAMYNMQDIMVTRGDGISSVFFNYFDKATQTETTWASHIDYGVSRPIYNHQLLTFLEENHTLHWIRNDKRVGTRYHPSRIKSIFVLQDRIYYNLDREIYVLDTNTEDRTLVADLLSISSFNIALLEQAIVFNGRLVFPYETFNNETRYASILLEGNPNPARLGTGDFDRILVLNNQLLLFNETELAETGQGVFISDGTAVGTLPYDWSAFADQPGGKVPDYALGNFLLFADEELTISTLDGSDKQHFNYKIDRFLDMTEGLNSDWFFWTDNYSESGQKVKTLNHLGTRADQFYSLPISGLLDGPEIKVNQTHLIIAGYTYQAPASNQQMSFLELPYAKFSNAKNLEVTSSSPCFGEQIVVQFNRTDASQVQWHLLDAQMVSATDSTVTLQIPSRNGAWVRVSYRNELDEHQTETIYISQSIANFASWGEGPGTDRITALVQAVNGCGN